MTEIRKTKIEIADNKFDYQEARKDLRKWLVKYTGCAIQIAENGEAYPCGTCLIHLLTKIGLDDKNELYNEHNKPIERHNEVWRAILQIRDSVI